MLLQSLTTSAILHNGGLGSVRHRRSGGQVAGDHETKQDQDCAATVGDNHVNVKPDDPDIVEIPQIDTPPSGTQAFKLEAASLLHSPGPAAVLPSSGVKPVKSTDVLVAGAGPAGLVLACILAKFGVPTVVIDQLYERPAIYGSRAVDARRHTLDLLELIDPDLRGMFEDHGQYLAEVEFLARAFGESQLEFSASFGDTYNQLQIPQVMQEFLLETYLAQEHPTAVQILRGHRLVWFRQELESVTADVEVLHDPSAEVKDYKIKSRWLVGCDGAQSLVRRLSGIGFPGRALPGTHWMVDAEIDDSELDNKFCVSVDFTRGLWKGLLIRYPPFRHTSVSRLVIPFVPGERAAPLLDLVKTEVQNRAAKFPIRLRAIKWVSVCVARFHVAAQMKLGRVFLCGDSAHCHSPFVGLGVGLAYQDACNLGWKLALAAKNEQVGGRFLKTYGPERIHVAQVTAVMACCLFVANACCGGLIVYLIKVFLWILKLIPCTGHVIGTTFNQSCLRYPVVDRAKLESFWKGRDFTKSVTNIGIGSKLANLVVVTSANSPGRTTERLYSSLSYTNWTAIYVDGIGTSSEDTTVWQQLCSLLPNEWNSHHVLPLRCVRLCFSAFDEEWLESCERRKNSTPSDIRPWPVLLVNDPKMARTTLVGNASNAIIIVRPDGYIAFRSRPADVRAVSYFLCHLFEEKS